MVKEVEGLGMWGCREYGFWGKFGVEGLLAVQVPSAFLKFWILW